MCNGHPAFVASAAQSASASLRHCPRRVDGVSGEEVLEATSAAVIKQMENDPRNVTGKAEEIRILKAEMRTELAQQILRRIAFYAASSQ